MPFCRNSRSGLRALIALLYATVGGVHLAFPAVFLPIVPDWVPWPRMIILGTGVCELLGSAALLTPDTRRVAGCALALYAVCVFPANLKHAFYDGLIGRVHLTWWYHAPRLMLQPVLVWAALYSGFVIDWPCVPRRSVELPD